MKRIFFILLTGCLPSCLLAQTTMTLQDAITIALKNSLDIRLARNSYEASIVNNHISIAGGSPTVSASANDNRSITNLNQELSNGTKTERTGVSNHTMTASVNGSLLLFNGFRVQATKSRLEALENQSEFQVNAEIQNVIANVMVNYFDIIRQYNYLRTIRESLAVTLERKRLVEARQSVGLANNTDRFQVELDSSAAAQELLSQELILNQAKSDLMNLLNLNPDTAVAISDSIVVDSTINVDTVINRLNLNPELLSAEQQIRINELIVREVGAQRYPAVSLNGGYNFNRSQNGAGLTLLNQTNGPFVGLNLSVPIFNGGAVRRQKRVAEINAGSATLSRQQVYNNLRTSVSKAYQAYANALVRLRTERLNNITAANLLNLVVQRFNLGVGTVIDLREAQRSYIEAGYRLINLSYAAKVAEIELKRLANMLTPA